MTRLLRGFAVAAAVALTGATAFADQPGVMKVTDDAGLFSAEGVARAAEQFDGTRFKSATHYGVGTISSVPEGKKADLAAAKSDEDRRRVFGAVARDTAFKNDRHGDVYTLVYMDEKGRYFVVTVSDKQSDIHRSFGDKKAQTVNDEFTKSLKRVKEKNLTGDVAKKEMDEALLAATKHVIDDLKHTAAPEQHAAGTHETSAPRAAAAGGGSSIMSYVCIGLVAFAGIWLVIGLVRSLFGGGGGYGGGGMGGGYGGGGGGGFMSSLLGGMFGAAAGMYMYDNFFGGHSSSAMAGDSYGGDTGGVDNADGDWDNGGQAGGGGGWDDAGGGDAGGGGGGWDDAGGGGDFGGGGGDFGGGGDW